MFCRGVTCSRSTFVYSVFQQLNHLSELHSLAHFVPSAGQPLACLSLFLHQCRVFPFFFSNFCLFFWLQIRYDPTIGLLSQRYPSASVESGKWNTRLLCLQPHRWHHLPAAAAFIMTFAHTNSRDKGEGWAVDVMDGNEVFVCTSFPRLQLGVSVHTFYLFKGAACDIDSPPDIVVSPCVHTETNWLPALPQRPPAQRALNLR